MKGVGVESPTDLARAIGLTDYSAPRNITRWLDGENAPGYEATILLLRAAGYLRDEALPSSPTAPDATLEAVQALDRRLDTDVIPRLDALAQGERARQRSST